jgi:hypothetical protein
LFHRPRYCLTFDRSHHNCSTDRSSAGAIALHALSQPGLHALSQPGRRTSNLPRRSHTHAAGLFVWTASRAAFFC